MVNIFLVNLRQQLSRVINVLLNTKLRKYSFEFYNCIIMTSWVFVHIGSGNFYDNKPLSNYHQYDNMPYMAHWHSPEHHIIDIYQRLCCQHVTAPNALRDIDHTNGPEYHVIVETTLWLAPAVGNRWRSISQAYVSGFRAQILKRILTLDRGYILVVQDRYGNYVLT